MIPETKLDFWIKNNLNILFIGKHGVGKSTIVIDAFNRAGLRWKYFSASTMDPWVDFIGVPKEKQSEDGKSSYLELIRPKEFQDDEVEALFFDEFGRCNKKIRNAVMELLQFKSINGKKFKNLRIIWAATNPKDEDATYDVDEIDEAQADRFHVKIELPYLPHLPYFRSVYGNSMARAAVNWWKKLADETKREVSPRRLDYALDIYKKKGDMRDVLPESSNVSKLIIEIQHGSIFSKLHLLYKKQDRQQAKKFLSIENNFFACSDEIIGKQRYIDFFIPLLETEKIISLMNGNKAVKNYLFTNRKEFGDLLMTVYKSGGNKTLVKQISKALNLGTLILPDREKQKCVIDNSCRIFKPKGTRALYGLTLSNLEKHDIKNTIDRNSVLSKIKDFIPPQMEKKHAIKTLEIISTIIGRSYPSTLQKNKYLIPMINLCFHVIYHSGETDLRDIQRDHVYIGKSIDYAMKSKENFFFNFVKK